MGMSFEANPLPQWHISLSQPYLLNLSKQFPLTPGQVLKILLWRGQTHSNHHTSYTWEHLWVHSWVTGQWWMWQYRKNDCTCCWAEWSLLLESDWSSWEGNLSLSLKWFSFNSFLMYFALIACIYVYYISPWCFGGTKEDMWSCGTEVAGSGEPLRAVAKTQTWIFCKENYS